METVLQVALKLSVEAHFNQKDQVNKPYIYHPMRVSHALLDETGDFELAAAGALHDVIEDTSCSYKDLYDAGMTDRVVTLVQAVTKEKGEGYFDFISRVIASDSKSILLLKRADVTDNYSRAGITASHRERYAKTLVRLNLALQVHLTLAEGDFVRPMSHR